MIRFALLALALLATGCVSDDDGEGAHLIVDLTCTQPFDSVIVRIDGSDNDIAVPSTTTYTYDGWEVFDIGPRAIQFTVTMNGNAVATAAASNIEYSAVGDGSYEAHLHLTLAP